MTRPQRRHGLQIQPPNSLIDYLDGTFSQPRVKITCLSPQRALGIGKNPSRALPVALRVCRSSYAKMQLESMELFALLGAPARMFGRLLLVSRYLWGGASYLGGSEAYSEGRYGRSWRWRIWLRYDLQELEVMEELINRGTDRKVLAFRKNQLDAFQMVSIVVCYISFLEALRRRPFELNPCRARWSPEPHCRRNSYQESPRLATLPEACSSSRC